jgi:hypothetical protein
MHGLDRKTLRREGRPCSEVIAELADSVRGYQLIADSSLDDHWLQLLASAADSGFSQRVSHIADWLDRARATTEEIVTAQSEMDRRSVRRHRAEDDALWLAGFMAILQKKADHRRSVQPIPISASRYASSTAVPRYWTSAA